MSDHAEEGERRELLEGKVGVEGDSSDSTAIAGDEFGEGAALDRFRSRVVQQG
jgi:hypothetical protein